MSNPITRGQVAQALECAYIESSELEEVIDNIIYLLGVAWDESRQTLFDFNYEVARKADTPLPKNPYRKES